MTGYVNCNGQNWGDSLYYPISTYDTVDSPATNLYDCCIACQTTLNCFGGFYNEVCLLAIQTADLKKIVNNMCPNGELTSQAVGGYSPPDSPIGMFKGPCSP